MRSFKTQVLTALGFSLMLSMGCGKKWMEGKAYLDNAPQECGTPTETAQADGCSHDSCTAAKKEAADKLAKKVPAECATYIKTGKPCKKGPGCK